MKRIYSRSSLIALLLVFCGSLFGQYAEVTYKVKVNEVKHRAYIINSCVVPSGYDDLFEMQYTSKAAIWDDVDSNKDESSCMQDEGTPDQFEEYGGGTYIGGKTNTSEEIYLRIKGWEDDDFIRCSFNWALDDCYIEITDNNYPLRFRELGAPASTYNILSQGERSAGSGFGGDDIRLLVDLYWHYSGSEEPLPITCTSQTITYNSGDIPSNSVYLEAGESYEFETTSGGDSYLRLYGTDGYTVVASDDNSGSGSYSFINYTATTTGWYYIEVSRSSRLPLTSNTKMTYRLVQTAPGDPSVFGDGQWIAYGYQGGGSSASQTGGYVGYYIDTYAGSNLNFDTNDMYPTSGGPDLAANWQGCDISGDDFSLVYKRTNFVCGYYEVAPTYNYSEVKMYVDGVEYNTTGDYYDFYTYKGYLGPETEVEIHYANDSEYSTFRMYFTSYTPDVGTMATELEATQPNGTCGGNQILVGVKSGSEGTLTDASLQIFYKGACGGTVMGDEDGLEDYPFQPTTYYMGLADQCSVLYEPCIALNVQVDATIEAIAGPDQLTCDGTATLEGNPSGPSSGTWTVVSGAATFANANQNNTTVTGLSDGENVLRWTLDNGICGENSKDVTINSGSLGDPDEYGDGHWLVHAFDGRSFDVSTLDYRGFYVHQTTNLSYDTRHQWNQTASPDNAPSWQGCTVPDDGFTYTYKRTNFTCGQYAINMEKHKNKVRLIVDGVTVRTFWGNGGPYTASWTGYLGPNSSVELVQQAWTTGNSYHKLNITPVTSGIAGTLGTISAPDSSCRYYSLDLTLPNAAPGNGEVIRWYTGECGGTLIGEGDSINVTQTEETTYYVRLEDDCQTEFGACDSVTVGSLAFRGAWAGSNQFSGGQCTVTMSANTPLEGLGTWSLVSGTATIDDVNDQYTTVSSDVDGTVWLRWTLDNNPQCSSSSDYVRIIFTGTAHCTNNKTNSGLAAEVESQVEALSLEAFPNPFSTSTTLRFSSPTDDQASMQVFDLNGRLVETLFEGDVNAGEENSIKFRPKGRSSGAYIVVLRTNKGGVINRRLIVTQ